MFGLSGTLRATEGRGDELERHLLEAAEHLGQVSTCHIYIVSRIPDEPEVVHVMEVWDDQDAHRDSLQLEPVQKLVERARPIIADQADGVELRPVGGKGL